MNNLNKGALVISALLMLTGCAANGTSVNQSNTQLSSTNINAAEQEELERINNMPYIDINCSSIAKALTERYDFVEYSSDSYMISLHAPIKGVDVDIVSQDGNTASVLLNIEPAILNADKNNEIKECVVDVFSSMEFTYDQEIWDFFEENYAEEITKTENTGFADPIIGLENENEGWSVVYCFLAEYCSIEIRPYKFY